MAYLSYYFDIGGTGTIIGSNSVYDPDDISLHEPDVVGMAIALCQVKKVLNKVHDIGTSVHVILLVNVS
jgi:hypothetical protein